jgi:thymidylate synthase
MNAHMRSNDALKAAFMNMYAFTSLQSIIADEIGNRINENVIVGTYRHIVDSYHIYGSYKEDMKKFKDLMDKRPFQERTYTTEQVRDIISDTILKVTSSESV